MIGIGRLRQAFRQFVQKMDDLLSIRAGYRGPGVKWSPAPASLNQSHRPPTDVPSSTDIDWIRGQFNSPTGIMRIRQGQLCALPLRQQMEFDPLARRVLCMTRWGRLIQHGKTQSFPNRFRGKFKRFSFNSTTATGVTALLGVYSANCNNYFHFWADTIADLWFLRESGIDLENIDFFVMPYGHYPWQRQILDICHIPMDKVMPLSEFTQQQCQELILPVRPKGGLISPTWLIQAIREMAGWTSTTGNNGNRLIYISRLDAQRRRLINEQQVIDYLHNQGFEIHQCSDFSVQEQQELFAQAKVIIAPHGAALTNIAWCSPGTLIVELIPENHLNPCFRDMCQMNRLEHDVIITSTTAIKGEVEVSLPAVRQLTENLLRESP